ncbi:3-hydroxyacyl-CoA dehydrogenase family protein [Kushneria sp. EE4]
MTRKIAIVGSGYMGGGIAQVMALAGAEVLISDVSLEVTQANRERLIEETRKFVADGLFPSDAVERIERQVKVAESIEDAVRDADFIEEAVPEKIDIKHEIFRRVSAAARPDAIIATNTSTISIAKLSEAVTHPERFLGVHFSNPSPFVPGVEIIPHEGTASDIVEKACAIVHETGKETATVKDVTGFVLNRLQYALFHEATQLLEEGVASAEDIDTLVRTTFGFRLPFFGPFAIADMAGLDVYNFCYQSLQTDFPERFATPEALSSLIDQGKMGTKSGGGFTDVPAERIPDLIAWRNRAYVKLSELMKELGPPPMK